MRAFQYAYMNNDIYSLLRYGTCYWKELRKNIRLNQTNFQCRFWQIANGLQDKSFIQLRSVILFHLHFITYNFLSYFLSFMSSILKTFTNFDIFNNNKHHDLLYFVECVMHKSVFKLMILHCFTFVCYFHICSGLRINCRRGKMYTCRYQHKNRRKYSKLYYYYIFDFCISFDLFFASSFAFHLFFVCFGF